MLRDRTTAYSRPRPRTARTPRSPERIRRTGRRTRHGTDQWLAAARRGRLDALRAKPAPGRPPKLAAAQRRQVPEFLWHGPEAYGFRGEVWTCGWVALVIERELGVRYHKDHIGRLLKQLGWTTQVAGHPGGAA
jgi:transposase